MFLTKILWLLEFTKLNIFQEEIFLGSSVDITQAIHGVASTLHEWWSKKVVDGDLVMESDENPKTVIFSRPVGRAVWAYNYL